MDDKAKQLIREYERESEKQANSRGIWQRVADAMYPYVQINAEFTPGSQRTQRIYDMTPYLDMMDMVSGFKQVLLPAGQTFFVIKVSSEHDQNDNVQRYLSTLTELVHNKLFASNFPTKIDDVLISLITFGPGSIFSQWVSGKGLMFRTSKIGSYVILEDDYENVIGSIHRFKRTASQAYEAWGDAAGPSVVKAVSKEETREREFWFIYRVAPRSRINPKQSRDYAMNMPYEACIVSEEDKVTVEESGFPENPFAIGRWSRPGYEKDGRGIGTEMLPQINVLFEQAKILVECGNKWVNPPRQAVADGVEGEVRTSPGALNWVYNIDNIRAMDGAMNGNFPIGKESLEMQYDLIHRAFFKNAFAPLQGLTGDRRTTLEIQERIRETLKLLGPPVGRIWYEILNPVLQRCTLEILRNRDGIGDPPQELAGAVFGIDYVGPLALALKSEQARAFQEWMAILGQVQAQFPDVPVGDHIDWHDAIPRLGHTLGVHTEDIATEDERLEKEQARQQAAEAQRQMEMAMAMGKAYKDGTAQPQPGSAAEQLAGMM